MFTHQREVCKSIMLEARLIKFCDLELAAVVFEMTTGTVRLAAGHVECAGVIPVLLLDPLGDLGMAFQALEAALSETKVVARGAFRRAFQVLMSLGQGPWRDLGANRANEPQHDSGQPKPPSKQAHESEA